MLVFDEVFDGVKGGDEILDFDFEGVSFGGQFFVFLLCQVFGVNQFGNGDEVFGLLVDLGRPDFLE